MIRPETLKAFINQVQKNSIEKPTRIQYKIDSFVKYTRNAYFKIGSDVIPEAEKYIIATIAELTKLVSDSSKEYEALAIQENLQLTSTSDQLFFLTNQLERKKQCLANQFMQIASIDLPPLINESYPTNSDHQKRCYGKQNIINKDMSHNPSSKLPQLDFDCFAPLTLKSLKI
ncbi:uncharacterized protein MONOS_17940 [Monocercomonoides exilis]|uniref:uncharacterized protein n=1 Tax=Monocercomonoides exilis TaxID=2049356 RepID=UPI003559E75D|nr:hypothetical protein MONOS_17940 [Monocercomonoides exilis]